MQLHLNVKVRTQEVGSTSRNSRSSRNSRNAAVATRDAVSGACACSAPGPCRPAPSAAAAVASVTTRAMWRSFSTRKNVSSDRCTAADEAALADDTGRDWPLAVLPIARLFQSDVAALCCSLNACCRRVAFNMKPTTRRSSSREHTAFFSSAV